MIQLSKPDRKIWLLRTILTAVLVGILFAIASQREFRDALVDGYRNLPALCITSVVLLLASTRLLQALAMKGSLGLTGVNISLRQCLQLAGLKGLYNLGFTGAGIAAQLTQAKISLGIEPRYFIFASVLQAALFFSSLLLLFGVVLLGFRLVPITYQPIIGFICIAISLAIVIGVLISFRPTKRIEKIPALALIQHLAPEITNYQALRSQIAYVYIYSLGLHIARSLRFICIMFFMASQVPLSFSMTAVLGADIVGQIPITPAGIGTRELALGYFGKVLSLFDIFLAAAIIDRTAAICFNLGHGLLSFFTLSFFSDSSPQ